MDHFLKWRFNFQGNKYRLPIEYLIITHPDADNFMGFNEIFNNDRFRINSLYQDRIVPNAGVKKFGKETVINKQTFLNQATDNQAKWSCLMNNPENMVDNDYLTMMKNALSKNNKSDFIEMLEYGKV